MSASFSRINVAPQTLDYPYLDRLTDVKFQPIFILGDHRSGTTLLYQTLAASGCFNAVKAYHIIKYEEILHNYIKQIEKQKLQELQDTFIQIGISDRVFDKIQVSPELPEEYGFIIRNSGHEPYLDTDSLEIFIEACRKVQFTSNLDKLLLLKNPWCYPCFKYIQKEFPNAKFIFIHRHPVHVINSKLKAVNTVLSHWNPYTSLISKKYNKIFKNPINRLIYRVMYSQQLNLGVNKVLKQSMKSTTYFLDNIDTISSKTYVSIRFEDFCERPQETLQKIFDFLQLVPQIPTDYDSLIEKRPTKLLPTVEKNQTRIYKQLKPYFDFHGYSA
jgi:thiol-disulfide isomerase/thioredoxin